MGNSGSKNPVQIDGNVKGGQETVKNRSSDMFVTQQLETSDCVLFYSLGGDGKIHPNWIHARKSDLDFPQWDIRTRKLSETLWLSVLIVNPLQKDKFKFECQWIAFDDGHCLDKADYGENADTGNTTTKGTDEIIQEIIFRQSPKESEKKCHVSYIQWTCRTADMVFECYTQMVLERAEFDICSIQLCVRCAPVNTLAGESLRVLDVSPTDFRDVKTEEIPCKATSKLASQNQELSVVQKLCGTTTHSVKSLEPVSDIGIPSMDSVSVCMLGVNSDATSSIGPGMQRSPSPDVQTSTSSDESKESDCRDIGSNDPENTEVENIRVEVENESKVENQINGFQSRCEDSSNISSEPQISHSPGSQPLLLQTVPASLSAVSPSPTSTVPAAQPPLQVPVVSPVSTLVEDIKIPALNPDSALANATLGVLRQLMEQLAALRIDVNKLSAESIRLTTVTNQLDDLSKKVEVVRDEVKQKTPLKIDLADVGSKRLGTVALQCGLCTERERTIMFKKCGHFLCCRFCAVQLPKCPICRVGVVADDLVTVFQS